LICPKQPSIAGAQSAFNIFKSLPPASVYFDLMDALSTTSSSTVQTVQVPVPTLGGEAEKVMTFTSSSSDSTPEALAVRSKILYLLYIFVGFFFVARMLYFLRKRNKI